MKPLALIIMDGWGIGKKEKGNAVIAAQPENFLKYWKEFPHTELKCSGKAVGLPDGSQGNSEVGHLHIGAGRIVFQPLMLINNTIRDGSFYKNPVLVNAIKKAVKENKKIHLLGLLSDTGVHATTKHLYALMKLTKKLKAKKVLIHAFLDGRDVPEKSAPKYLKELEKEIKKNKTGRIASIIGRYYAMDRDNNWDRTKQAVELLVKGTGFKEKDALKAIQNAYNRGDQTDYYVKPIIIEGEKNENSLIEENDLVVFFNFRSDRSRQLTKCFTEKKFGAPKTDFVCMTRYDKKIKAGIAFEQKKVKNNLGSVLAENRLKQLRIAETEKYAHVTFFFNSQTEKPNKGETRILVNSPKVPSYDLKPEMSAIEVKEKAIQEIKKDFFDVIIINFANTDLVGHSGKLDAAIKAVKTVDSCVGEIVKEILGRNGTAIITADHGNAEQMFYQNREACPSHTLNKVPCILVTGNEKLKKAKLRRNSGLIGIAPTMLKLLGIKKPKEMAGRNLIR
ncbi:MAG: 2,3-bisphosphoglycerate-independent phosphoglycerate mutase [archaeon]